MKMHLPSLSTVFSVTFFSFKKTTKLQIATFRSEMKAILPPWSLARSIASHSSTLREQNKKSCAAYFTASFTKDITPKISTNLVGVEKVFMRERCRLLYVLREKDIQ
jgi:hypothetical protein